MFDWNKKTHEAERRRTHDVGTWIGLVRKYPVEVSLLFVFVAAVVVWIGVA